MTNLLAGFIFLIIGISCAAVTLPGIRKKKQLEKRLWEIQRERNNRLAGKANKMAKRREEEE